METIERVVELFRRGEVQAAELACERRLAARGDDAEAALLLAEIHLATGRGARAAALLAHLVRLRPFDAAAHRRLAQALLADARPGEAVVALRRAIALEPLSARAHNNLGQALMRLGETSEAIASYEQALRLDPSYAIAFNNLALALTESSELERAIDCFRQALRLNPSLASAQVDLGSLHAREQRFEEALECFERALTLEPRDSATLIRRAAALRELGRQAEALASLDRALALEPLNVEAWCSRGLLLHEQGQLAPALAAYRRALEIDPDCIEARTRLLARLIPQVPLTAEEAAGARRAFEAELETLQDWMTARDLSEEETLRVAGQQFFYLSYDEQPNKQLLVSYRGAAARRLAGFDRWAPTGAARRAGVTGCGRFRLGFVSAHVFDHSVYNAILKGWLEHLDRTRFEISLFIVGSKQDAVTEAACALCDHVERGARAHADWARVIRERKPDALIYPEIGMNETTLALASARLAPRQFAAWGHPETSGLPTIDRYLSAELFEPADAEAHYSERLARLPNLGVYYRPYETPSAPIDLAALGIHREAPLLVCPGVPFKYRPQDDWMLVDIARRLESCTFLFFRHQLTELSLRLEERIATAFRKAHLHPERYIVSVPWQPRGAFFALLRRADVYLDTVGFSGFNGLMQAVECELPCVSYEGRFMRGRFGSGILQHLGLSECVAFDKAAYVDIAVKLASSTADRETVRQALRRRAASLYQDHHAIDALARLLLDDESLPSGAAQVPG